MKQAFISIMILAFLTGCCATVPAQKTLTQEIQESLKLLDEAKPYYSEAGGHFFGRSPEYGWPALDCVLETYKAGSFGAQIIPYLMNVITDTNNNARFRWRAVNVLNRVLAPSYWGEIPGETLWQVFRESKKPEEAFLRLCILKALLGSEIKDSLTHYITAFDVAKEALNHQDMDIKAVAAEWLWDFDSDNYRTKEFILSLIEFLKDYELNPGYPENSPMRFNSFLLYICPGGIFEPDYYNEDERQARQPHYQTAINWWNEYNKFLYLRVVSDDNTKTSWFSIDETAHKYSIPVDLKTGDWLDPKDGHRLMHDEKSKLIDKYNRTHEDKEQRD